MSYKLCGNCNTRGTVECVLCQGTGELWAKIPCPYCGGVLSELRQHNNRVYRHCFSCNFEFEEVTNREDPD